MSETTVDRRTFLELGGTALAAALAGCNIAPPSPPPESTETPAESSSEPSSTETPSRDESVYTQVYRETIDSVVLVRTAQGQGTGLVFDDGHVVTNAHVVGQARRPTFAFAMATGAAERSLVPTRTAAWPRSASRPVRKLRRPCRSSTARRRSARRSSPSGTRTTLTGRSRPASSAGSTARFRHRRGSTSQTRFRPTPRSTRATAAAR
jgi:hypothetical protein